MSTKEQVLELIRKSPDKSRHEISQALGLPLTRVAEAIRELEKDEAIELVSEWVNQ